MIETIAHLSDIHIRKSPLRNNEYEEVFEKLYLSLEEKKPDRIVIVGDLVHDYLDLQGEQLILASSFLNRLAEIAPVRIIRGNHDMRKKSIKRVDSVKAIVKSINNLNIIYYNETGFFDDDNVTWAVWKHGEKNNNPWKIKNKNISDTNIVIDLFHDPIQGSSNNIGFEFKSKTLTTSAQLKGKFSLVGDIHKQQYLNKSKTKAYSGSLLGQDFTEGDNVFHGYLLWNIINETVEEISIPNNYSFKNIYINPFTDFNGLNIKIDNPTLFMKIRVIWRTLPATKTKANERKISEYLKGKYNNITITNKNEFIEDDKIDVKENITIEKIVDQSTQHEIFKNYLIKIGVDQKIINEIIMLDDEISSRINAEELTNIEWEIIKFNGKNFMSYIDLDIDWRNMDGIIQIYGNNEVGKTTIIKLLTYILYNKCLETETRIEFGDKRYLNNKIDTNFCEGNIVIKANDQYYGIKRRTELLKTNKAGEIIGAPTTLKHYLLETPDDDFTEENSLTSLNEDIRKKTQKVIERVIGSYDNFMRVVFTTSDTLNKILSNQMADFIDSLLYDSGLDIFDLKLKELKVYQTEENNNIVRVSCNVDATNNNIMLLMSGNTITNIEIKEIELITLPAIQEKIKMGNDYVEKLIKKLHKIDSEIYNLNVENCNTEITEHEQNIVGFNEEKKVLEVNIKPLKEAYDEKKLTNLLIKKEEHKTNVYNQNLTIKTHEQIICDEDHAIEIINGDVIRLKKDGTIKKEEIIKLKKNKQIKNPICPTCKQEIVPDHLKHIDEHINNLEKEMFDIADQIKIKENIDKIKHQNIINNENKTIVKIKENIINAGLEMEIVLKEIGELTNDKNDVEKRKEIQAELDKIPFQIENEELKIDVLKRKVEQYNQSLIQIEENKKIEKVIIAAKDKLILIKETEDGLKNDIIIKKGKIDQNNIKIDEYNKLLIDFTAQEKRDNVFNLYKKCVHRDGIPTQMLINHIIPKINTKLSDSLANVPFTIWLNPDDLRLKFAQVNAMDAVIDAISSSGKQRTFAALALKSALNEINAKSKPSMFLMDELTGKLDDKSMEEFVEFIHLIKTRMKKVMIVEYKSEIDPDYIITVTIDENGISRLEIE